MFQVIESATNLINIFLAFVEWLLDSASEPPVDRYLRIFYGAWGVVFPMVIVQEVMYELVRWNNGKEFPIPEFIDVLYGALLFLGSIFFYKKLRR